MFRQLRPRSVTAAILGFFVGGVVALLMAPSSGKQSREFIVKKAKLIKRKR